MKRFEAGEIFSGHDVSRFIESIHYNKKDFWEGDLEEHIEAYDTYQVREIPLSEIENPSYYLDEDLLAEYSQLEMKNMPPIVLGFYTDTKTYQTIDGGHRVTIAKQKNMHSFLAFVALV